MSSAVSRVPAASSADALAHFEALLQLGRAPRDHQ